MAHATPELSDRERQILHLAAEGRTNEQIAAALCLSPSTVSSYFQRIYAKANIRDQRKEAIYRYLRGGRYATE